MLTALHWLDRLSVLVATLALVSMVMLICVSVTGRYLFAMPVPDDLVFSEFLMVFIVFLPLGSVQAAREHVFVTIFTEWMTNRQKVLLETVGVFVGLITFAIISVAVYQDFRYAWDYGSYVDGPLELVEWPANFVVFFGITLFTIRLAIDTVQSIVAVIKDTGTATKSEEERVLEADF